MQVDCAALVRWLMLRDGANGSIVCGLLKQRGDRKGVKAMHLKETFQQAGLNPATLSGGGQGVCV
jgi:hypothetical protein